MICLKCQCVLMPLSQAGPRPPVFSLLSTNVTYSHVCLFTFLMIGRVTFIDQHCILLAQGKCSGTFPVSPAETYSFQYEHFVVVSSQNKRGIMLLNKHQWLKLRKQVAAAYWKWKEFFGTEVSSWGPWGQRLPSVRNYKTSVDLLILKVSLQYIKSFSIKSGVTNNLSNH